MTNSQFLSRLEAVWTSEDVEVASVKDLFPPVFWSAIVTTPFYLLRDKEGIQAAIRMQSRSGETDQGRPARVVDVQEVRVEIKVLLAPNLDSGVRRALSERTRRKFHLGEDGERREPNFREALGRELAVVGDDDILNVPVGGTVPRRLQWLHDVKISGKLLPVLSFQTERSKQESELVAKPGCGIGRCAVKSDAAVALFVRTTLARHCQGTSPADEAATIRLSVMYLGSDAIELDAKLKAFGAGGWIPRAGKSRFRLNGGQFVDNFWDPSELRGRDYRCGGADADDVAGLGLVQSRGAWGQGRGGLGSCIGVCSVSVAASQVVPLRWHLGGRSPWPQQAPM